MAEDTSSTSRNDDRHSHISIGLRLRAGEQWERLDALGWNDVGFNFYHPREIHSPLLELKRGITAFEATIVWRSLDTSDEVLRSTLVNELIFKRAQEVAHNAALHHRLIKLIRVPGMVAQKLKILASLGLDLDDLALAELLERRKRERPLFHYGVKLESEVWSASVKSALELSSVVIALEKWAGSLARK